MHWVLSAPLYFDQFSLRVSWAVRSSPMQASLSRPIAMAPRAAALQLGATLRFGGPSAGAAAVCRPSNRATDAMVVVEADIGVLACGLPRAQAPPRRIHMIADYTGARAIRGGVLQTSGYCRRRASQAVRPPARGSSTTCAT